MGTTSQAKADDPIPAFLSAALILDRNKKAQGTIYICRDMREHIKAEKQLQETQNLLVHSEKMAGIGLLAAGVAHEINNPMGYIISNVQTLGQYLKDIFEGIDELKEGIEKNEECRIKRDTLLAEGNIDYIEEDVPILIQETLDGADRVKRIVSSLREFVHPGEDEFSPFDINQEIEKTLSLVWNELKYHCEVEKEFGLIPKIICNKVQLGEIFINLLINAAQATEGMKGRIIIKTHRDDSHIILRFSDNGKGIPEENLGKISDPFFTTKEIGR
ncbi:MAG: hypothetical protein JXA95_06715, partial [Spirochaetales bacterium]|nr:hypothetical protein [Spirochaetales bacterium]